MKKNKATKQLIVLGLVLICCLQYPLLALITPKSTLWGIPIPLYSLLIVWIVFILLLNLIVNRKKITSRVEDHG